MNKKLFIRIAIIVGSIGVVGLALWQGPHLLTRLAPPSPSTSASPTASPSALPTVTYEKVPADWQVYSSASLGLQVSFPKDWKRGPCGETCIAFASPADPATPLIGINITASGSIAEVVKNAGPYAKSNETVTFNGITWTRLVLQEPQTGNVFISHFAVAPSGKLYEFGLGTMTDDVLRIYGQMVQSLKFTK